MAFQRGKAANPTGRNGYARTPEQKRALADAWRLCPVAMAELEKLLTAEDTDPRLRHDVAKTILDRALGKPHQSVAVSDDREQPSDLPVAIQAQKLREAADRLEAESKGTLQ